MQIVCSSKSLKSKKRKTKLIAIILILVFLFVSIIVFFKKRINPAIIEIASTKINLMTNQIINTAIIENYRNFQNLEFVKVIKDSNGKVNSVQTDVSKVNSLINTIANGCNLSVETIGNQGFNIPFGSLIGIPILASAGPNINLKFYPVGTIEYDYDTVFESCGINQTIHKLYLNINANMVIIYGLSNPKISINHQILISETIIVGDVPDFMLNRT